MSGSEELFAELLDQLGMTGDPEMAQTPERFTSMLAEFAPTGEIPALSTFPVATSGPVVLRDLPFYSLCAHHLLPFFGTVTVVYEPSDVVAGLGGIPRVLRHFARQPQLQERLAEQLAEELTQQLAPKALVVRLTARQMCVEMRGAESPGTFESIARRGEVDSTLLGLLS